MVVSYFVRCAQLKLIRDKKFVAIFERGSARTDVIRLLGRWRSDEMTRIPSHRILLCALPSHLGRTPHA